MWQTPPNDFTLVLFMMIATFTRLTKSVRQADFFNIVAWGKTGEFCSKYFKKGQQVGVIGRLQTRNWDDENGQKHYATEVVAEEVYFADSRRDGEGASSVVDTFGEDLAQNADFQVNATDDDLPF